MPWVAAIGLGLGAWSAHKNKKAQGSANSANLSRWQEALARLGHETDRRMDTGELTLYGEMEQNFSRTKNVLQNQYVDLKNLIMSGYGKAMKAGVKGITAGAGQAYFRIAERGRRDDAIARSRLNKAGLQGTTVGYGLERGLASARNRDFAQVGDSLAQNLGSFRSGMLANRTGALVQARASYGASLASLYAQRSQQAMNIQNQRIGLLSGRNDVAMQSGFSTEAIANLMPLIQSMVSGFGGSGQTNPYGNVWSAMAKSPFTKKG